MYFVNNFRQVSEHTEKLQVACGSKRSCKTVFKYTVQFMVHQDFSKKNVLNK